MAKAYPICRQITFLRECPEIMLKRIIEEARYVEITGFEKVKIQETEALFKIGRIEDQLNTSTQFFNAELVATWEHLYFAVLNALMAFRTRRNLSRSLAVEAILYASAQRRIQKAFETIGVRSGTANVAVTIVGDTAKTVEVATESVSRHFRSEPVEQVLELSTAKMRKIRSAFMINDTELRVVTKAGDIERALTDLVIERMALLATRL